MAVRCSSTIALALAALAAIAFAAASEARPYVPSSDSDVLERLPEASDPKLAELRPLRAALARSPGDVDAASAFARSAIKASRNTGDPRFLGYAQAALAPWWSADDAPAQALLLRATIKQSRHEFGGALADLDRLLAAHPGDSQAILTRATILTVVGRYGEAERDCARLVRRASTLIIVTCKAVAASLSGRASVSYRELQEALAGDQGSDPGVRAWSLALAAEIAARLGEADRAEAHYRAALAIDPLDTYARGAYADFLLDAGRPREAAALVAQQTKNDPLLLRLVLAEKRLPDAAPQFALHRAELAARFDAARRRGDAMHAREEARFRLLVEEDAPGALALAKMNWNVQREAADLHVLVDAAIAANDRSTLAEAAEWVTRNQLEDVALAARIGSRR